MPYSIDFVRQQYQVAGKRTGEPENRGERMVSNWPVYAQSRVHASTATTSM